MAPGLNFIKGGVVGLLSSVIHPQCLYPVYSQLSFLILYKIAFFLFTPDHTARLELAQMLFF